MSKTAPQIDLQFIKYSKNEKKPAYRQLYESFKAAVLNGALKPGDRLPASRQLADEVGVSRNVIILVFEQLQIEGYIVSQTGKGSYVADNIIQLSPPLKKRALEESSVSKQKTLNSGRYNEAFLQKLQKPIVKSNAEREKILPFQISVPDLSVFPFNTWISLAAKAHRYMNTYHLGYEDAAGYLPLRTAIANYIRINRGVTCVPEQIIITHGSRQALWLLGQLLLQKGDSYWMENPGYHGADFALANTGAKPCYIPITPKHGMDIDFATKNFPAAKLAYLTPSHQFPLGGTMPLAKRQQLIEWASKHNMWIIEDDYDSELRYEGKLIPSLQGMDDYNNVIYVGTFSKVIFPALRIGYVVMPTKEDASLFALSKALSDRQHTLMDQMILTSFIEEGHYGRMLKKMRIYYAQKLQFVLDLLNNHLSQYITYNQPQAGMHLTCFFISPMIAETFFQKTREANLIVHSLLDYAQPPFETPAFLLGYTAFKERQLSEGIMNLKKIFQSID